MAAMSERFELRLDEEMVQRIDRWRMEDGEGVSRAEAVRRLVEAGLTRLDKRKVSLTDAERLMVGLLCDIGKQLQEDGRAEMPYDFIMSCIYGGHTWALKWDLGGLFPNHDDRYEDVKFVVDVIDMFSFVESAYEKLDKADRENVDASDRKHWLRFNGFDGNNEIEFMSIAMHLIRDMGRWERFKDRDLNSHMPVAGRYAAMVKIFEPMRRDLGAGRELGADQLSQILEATER